MRPLKWPKLGQLVCGELSPFPQYRLPPGTLSGDEALNALWALGEHAALNMLAVCAAALCLYPAWERRIWGMPDTEGLLNAYGGEFLRWPGELTELGIIWQQPGRANILPPASSLAFALYAQPTRLVLVLGGTNTSHSDSQLRTFPSEARQFGADLLNVLGRLPALWRGRRADRVGQGPAGSGAAGFAAESGWTLAGRRSGAVRGGAAWAAGAGFQSDRPGPRRCLTIPG